MDAPFIKRDAQCWPTVQLWAAHRIETLRGQLEQTPAEMVSRVAKLQGGIEELRHLLKQGQEEETRQAASVY